MSLARCSQPTAEEMFEKHVLRDRLAPVQPSIKRRTRGLKKCSRFWNVLPAVVLPAEHLNAPVLQFRRFDDSEGEYQSLFVIRTIKDLLDRLTNRFHRIA